MRKKLAIGLFCAVFCGFNLAYARSLQAGDMGNCYAYDCQKNATCRYEVSCDFCLVIDPELELGFCMPY